MAFKKFTEVGKSFNSKASINPRGIIGFTNGARTRYNIDEYESASLYYDEDERKIGIELKKGVANNEEDSIKIRIRQTTGADIFAKSFFDFFKIDLKNTKIYELSKDSETGFLVIDLKGGKIRNSKSNLD